jgi:hypothetical protein
MADSFKRSYSPRRVKTEVSGICSGLRSVAEVWRKATLQKNLLRDSVRGCWYQAVFFSLHAMQTDVQGTALRRAKLISSSQIVQIP